MNKDCPLGVQYNKMLLFFEGIYPKGLNYVKGFDVAHKSPMIYGIDMWKAKRIIDDFIKSRIEGELE